MTEVIDELRSLIVTKNSKVVEIKKKTGEDREKVSVYFCNFSFYFLFVLYLEIFSLITLQYYRE